MGTSLIPNNRRRNKRRQLTEINVTPFVDVMLVLLIIFMVTAPLLTAGVPVNLPKTKAANISGQDEPLVVSLTDKGEIYIQETLIAFDKVAPHIKVISDNNPDVRLFIRADKDLDYGSVMQLMGALTVEGFRKVALITQSDK